MRRGLEILASLALVFLLFAGASTPAQAQANDAASALEATLELETVEDLYRIVTSYHIMLEQEGATSDVVNSVVFDVVRYVDEIDSHYALAKLFIKDPQVMDAIEQVVAKAHLQAALLHARGIDLEGSIDQYEEAIALIGHDLRDWDGMIERRAKTGLLPGASEIVFEMATPQDIMEDLRHFWAAGAVTRFQIQEFTREQRVGLQLVRVGGATDPFSEAFFALAAKRFSQRAALGLEEFRVVLPSGLYNAYSPDQTVESMQFRIDTGGIPDPIVLNPNSFSFNITTDEGDACLPTMTLNGITQKSMVGLPFGTYRLKTPAACDRRLPDKITVEQRDEVTLRTEPERLDMVREGQPIFLFVTTPPGSTYNLRF